MPECAPASGRSVLVVGAGPCGLAAAYHLRLLGHDVTLRDTGDRPGGMMRYGIPRYRLPREVLDAEIDRIVAMGVRLELGSTVPDIEAAMTEGGFDAALLAVGAQTGRRAYLPAADTARILDAVKLLHDVEDANAPLLGRRVVVYGGGNTAIDAARTAKRLGATEAVIVYRRTRDRMPAEDSEVEEAVEEGVMLRWLSTIKHVDADRILVERMELDETGFPQPTGEVEELESDAVVLALGQESDLELVSGAPSIDVEDGVVVVDEAMMTGRPGVFAGGDMVAGARTVTSGVGHGTRAARNIDAWLRATTWAPERDRPGGRLRPVEHLVLLRGSARRARPARGGPPYRRVRRGGQRPHARDGAVRGPPLPVLRQLLRVRQLLRRLPGQRHHQAGAGQRLQRRPRLLQGLRAVRGGVPGRGDRDGARADLTHPTAPVPDPPSDGHPPVGRGRQASGREGGTGADGQTAQRQQSCDGDRDAVTGVAGGPAGGRLCSGRVVADGASRGGSDVLLVGPLLRCVRGSSRPRGGVVGSRGPLQPVDVGLLPARLRGPLAVGLGEL